MASTSPAIPDKTLFKASEVCEMAELQPFVLRSWEKEFPDLGVRQKGKEGGARLYRRADVDRVLEIRQLVFGEGLTLAGVRRRLEEQQAVAAAPPDEETLLSPELRRSILAVREGLAGLLQILSGAPGGSGDVGGASASPQPAAARAPRTRARAAKSKQPA